MSTNRNRRRSRVRYDRIIGILVIFIILMILFVSCCKSCGDGKGKDDESSIVPTSNKSDSAADEAATEETTEAANFSTVSAMPNEISKGDLILVNNDHPYEFPAVESDSNIVTIYDNKTDSYMARDYEISLGKETILALNDLMDSFYNISGLNNLMVNSGYRTKADQDEDYNNGESEIKGGCSEYHTGLNFSLSVWSDSPYYYESSGEYAWVAENCANYGIITRYPEGKENKTGIEGAQYKFRYVGIPHAVYMYNNQICLEEYLAEVKNYTFEGDHLKVTSNEKNYEIYYVPQNPSTNTEIPVPTDKSYTISGNNMDGFIVTVIV